MTFPYTPAAAPSTFPLSPCKHNSSKGCLYTGQVLQICHIHLYFPFTMGHLNHIRIYYHHADSAPIDSTNHDKRERWLHKNPCLYITSYELGRMAEPTCDLCDRPFIWMEKRWGHHYISTSLTCVWYYPSQTIVRDSCVCICVCLQKQPSISSRRSKSVACEERFML